MALLKVFAGLGSSIIFIMPQYNNRRYSFVGKSFLKVLRDEDSDDDGEEAVELSEDERDSEIFPVEMEIDVNVSSAADQSRTRRSNFFNDFCSTFSIDDDADAGVASFSA